MTAYKASGKRARLPSVPLPAWSMGAPEITNLRVRSCRLSAERRALPPSAAPPCSSKTPSKILSARLSEVAEGPGSANGHRLRQPLTGRSVMLMLARVCGRYRFTLRFSVTTGFCFPRPYHQLFRPHQQCRPRWSVPTLPACLGFFFFCSA